MPLGLAAFYDGMGVVSNSKIGIFRKERVLICVSGFCDGSVYVFFFAVIGKKFRDFNCSCGGL